ncbi:GIY-YIG nuclease family protein [Microvirga sp. 2TAF3]|uniref:GIY-YIG nuclease family protein n=1 Tax=Microvirga sp. 2TAF3 TaxID=3233014 RepID=UPI003F95B49A
MAHKSDFRPNLKVFGINPIDPGWIYMIKHGDLIKIGKSKNPTKRILQAKTWLPALEVVGVKPFWNISDVERRIHEGLTQSWYDREWFSFKDDEFGPVFIDDFQGFYDDDRDMNSVDFIYWFNGSGMAELAMERHQQGLSLPKWFNRESNSKRK